jgi:hypothetical protein
MTLARRVERRPFHRVALACAVLTAVVLPLVALSAAESDAAGSSSVTVNAPNAGANAKVTVSKTAGLRNETVNVSWKGFEPSSANQLNNAGSSYDTQTLNPVRVYECRGDDMSSPSSSSDCYGSGGFRGIPPLNGNPGVPAVPGFTYPGQTDDYANTPDGPANFQDTVTTNDGSGTVTIQVFTRLESSSLGCDDSTPCSIVVVPNYGRDNGTGATEDQIDAPWAWDRRVVVPLDFAPLEISCGTSVDSLPIQGSPMSARLIASWRGGTCLDKSTGISLDYTMVPEEQARGDVSGGVADLGLISKLIPASTAADANLVQAPVSVSGITVGFQIDDANGQRVTNMNLNARLVTKLITASYRIADDPNVENNPSNIFQDPEFLKLNPGVDWPSGAPGNHVLLLGDLSDTTYALTRWIASDPEARAFIAGKPDQWGMRINQKYKNVELPFSTFPLLDKWQSDNYEPIQGMDHLSRQLSLAQFPGAIVTYEDGVPVVSKPPRQNPGRREVIGIVDTADADSFMLDAAKLQNAGGSFVGPTQLGMSAAMKTTKPGESMPDLSDKNKDIYPLTTSISAVARLQADKSTREAAAKFLLFAAGRGQQPGTGMGDLPAGHLPLSASMRAETRQAAADLRAGVSSSGEHDPPKDETDPTTHGGTTTGDTTGAALANALAGADGSGDPAGASDDPKASDITSPAAFSVPEPWTSSIAVPIAIAIGLVALVAGLLTSWMTVNGKGPAWLRR